MIKYYNLFRIAIILQFIAENTMTNKFSQLQNLLAVKNWQEADRETRRIL